MKHLGRKFSVISFKFSVSENENGDQRTESRKTKKVSFDAKLAVPKCAAKPSLDRYSGRPM
jgi:hypothetical protein